MTVRIHRSCRLKPRRDAVLYALAETVADMVNDTDDPDAGVMDRSQQLFGFLGCYGGPPNGLSI